MTASLVSLASSVRESATVPVDTKGLQSPQGQGCIPSVCSLQPSEAGRGKKGRAYAFMDMRHHFLFPTCTRPTCCKGGLRWVPVETLRVRLMRTLLYRTPCVPVHTHRHTRYRILWLRTALVAIHLQATPLRPCRRLHPVLGSSTLVPPKTPCCTFSKTDSRLYIYRSN